MKKVSIIVPVYKIPYDVLKLGIKSIILQSYSNIEIILVDDGSPDSCGEICDTFAQEDQRIKVYHKVNEGVSTARNLGLKKSTGEYILFVDADDYLHPCAVEIMLATALSNKSDIVVCSYERFFSIQPKISNFSTSYFTKSFESKTELDCLREKCLIENGKLGARFNGAPWAKLYKKSLLEQHSITFDVDLLRSQDNYFNFQVFGHANKVTYVNLVLYYYRFLAGSAVNRFRKNHFEVTSAYLSTLKKCIDKNDKFGVFYDLYQRVCIEKLCEYVGSNVFHNDNKTSFNEKCFEINNAFVSLLPSFEKKELFSLDIDRRSKIMFSMIVKRRYHLLFVYCLLIRFLRKIKYFIFK